MFYHIIYKIVLYDNNEFTCVHEHYLKIGIIMNFLVVLFNNFVGITYISICII